MMKKIIISHTFVAAVAAGLVFLISRAGDKGTADLETKERSTAAQRTSHSSVRNSFKQGLKQLSTREINDSVRLLTEANGSFQDELSLKLYMSELAGRDIGEALAIAKEFNRQDLMQIALRSVKLEQADFARDWILDNGVAPADQKYFMLSLLRGVAGSDKDVAFAKAEKWFDQLTKNEAHAVIIQEWTKSNPEEVLKWIGQQKITPLIDQSYQLVMKEIISRDPNEYKYLVEQLSSGSLKNNLSKVTAQSLAKNDPAAAKQWLESLSGEEKKSALYGLLEGWTSTGSGDEIFDYLKEKRNTESYKDAFRIAAVNLSYSDPETVEKKFNEMTKDEQAITADYLAISFAMNDPKKAQSWVRALPPGNTQDIALSRIAGQLQYQDPNSAFNLALDIRNGGKKMKVLEKVIKKVGRSDLEAAKNLLLNANGLTDTERYQLDSILGGVEAPGDILIPEL